MVSNYATKIIASIVFRQYNLKRCGSRHESFGDGVPKKIPIPEEYPQRPINPYGSSKLMVERMLADLGHAHGLQSITLRYFNAAGADLDGDIGEAHDPEPHLIPRVLAAARDGTAVTVYGNDYETPDGTCIRDYIHVADIADAHVRALEYLLSGGSSCALNLANAQGYSVMDVIQAAQRVSGKTIRVEVAPRRPGDPRCLSERRIVRVCCSDGRQNARR